VGHDLELPPLVLTPEEELVVWVMDAAGRPVGGALVSAIAGPEADLWPHPSSSREPQWRRTDVRGRAVVGRGHDEAVALAAVAPGFAPVRALARKGERPLLRLEPGAPALVEVRDGQKRPVAEALVSEEDSGLPLGMTDEDGRVAIRRPASGPLSLVAQGEAGRGRALVGLQGRKLREGGPTPPVPMVLEPPRRYAGQVIEGATREPVAAALVWLDGSPDRSAATDGRGAYSLAVDASSGFVGARRRAFLMAAAPGLGAGRERVTDERQTVILLPAVATVAGRVADAGGRGVEGVVVSADEIGSWWAPAAEGRRVRTGPGGAFRLGGLAPEAAHRLLVAEPDFAPTEVEVVTPAAGGVRGGVEIVLSRGARATGLVLGAYGLPAAGAEVTLERSATGRRFSRVRSAPDAPPPHTATAAADGRFSLGLLAPGLYELAVVAAGHARLEVPVIEVAPDSGELDLGTLQLEAGEELAGRVVDVDGGPVEGARVVRPGGGREEVTSGADGRFVVDGLDAGRPVDLWVECRGFTSKEVAGVPVPAERPLVIELERAAALEGRVVDASGSPVPGASVSVRPAGETFGGSAEAEGDEDGRFVVEGVTAGRIVILARAEGHATQRLDDVVVAPGERRRGLRLVLERGATLAGRVASPEGDPVHGAMVWAQPTEGSAGAGLQGDGRGDRTDGAGRYRVTGVTSGEVEVTVIHPDYVRAVQETSLPEGGDSVLDFRLQRGHDVAGWVVDEVGAPVAAAHLQVESALGSSVSDPDGAFVLRGVPPGMWRLSAEKEGYAEAEPQRRIEVAGPVSGLQVRLVPATTITGQVRGIESSDLARVMVLASGEGGGASAILEGVVDLAGVYRVDGAGPGDWRVVATVGDGGGMATGTVGVEPGQREAHLDLELGGDLLLSGRVTLDGKPLAGATVGAAGRDSGGFGHARTDADGRFVVEGLARGAYELSVVAPRGGARHQRLVELQSDLELTIDLQVHEIAGRVVDAETGAPVGGAEVRLVPAGEAEPMGGLRTLTSLADGAFRLGEVVPGRYVLTAGGAAGYADATMELSIGPEAPVLDVEVVLEPSGGAEIEVSGPFGAPPEWVMVAALHAGTPPPPATVEITRPAYGASLRTGEGGRARLRGLGEGLWRVLVAAPSHAVAAVELSAPGPAVRVSLAPEAVVDITVPGVGAVEGGRVVLLDATGRTLQVPEWGGAVRGAWRLSFGRARIEHVPAGTWTVVATTPDGPTRQATVTAVAGAVAEVVLD
jgi:protocatechuate 3,4-dioxygenase beta subunit